MSERPNFWWEVQGFSRDEIVDLRERIAKAIINDDVKGIHNWLDYQDAKRKDRVARDFWEQNLREHFEKLHNALPDLPPFDPVIDGSI